jgi:hypothetical protein
MQIVNGQKYTFHFQPSGVDMSGPFSNQGDAVVKSLIDAGFPIASPSATQGGTAFGYLGVKNIDVAFTYEGLDTDDQSLGNAMANHLTSDFVTSYFTYGGSDSGKVTDPGSLTAMEDKITSALPSWGIAAVAVLLIAVGIYSFAGHAAERI